MTFYELSFTENTSFPRYSVYILLITDINTKYLATSSMSLSNIMNNNTMKDIKSREPSPNSRCTCFDFRIRFIKSKIKGWVTLQIKRQQKALLLLVNSFPYFV